MSATTGKLLAIDVSLGGGNEVLSGVYRNRPRIYARLADEGCSRDLAFVVIHPTSNFMGHYLIEPLQARGRAVLALNTRFVGNDANLILERAIQDLGAGVRYLRDEGYKRICLVGNSGGGALVAMYQAQAEKPTIRSTPDGTPMEFSPGDMPPADSIALVAAHPGRARTYTARMDAAVVDENDLLSSNPALDIFNLENGPPFSPEFVARVRQAQIDRNRRITAWCQARLALAKSLKVPITDQPFIIHRTHADPRYLDHSLDPSDRKPGTSHGESIQEGNYKANNLGRISTLKAWLSQWSCDLSQGDGPPNLARTTVPVLVNYFTGDATTFPSDIRDWCDAAGARGERVDFKGVPHYPHKHPDQIERLATLLAEWGMRA